MARHRAPPAHSEERQDYDAPAIPGGSAGIPMTAEESTRPIQSMAGPERQRRAREWMVTDGPRTADGLIPYMSEGYRVNLKPGKLVTEATHDLGSMRRQGIKLELVPEQPEEQEVAPVHVEPAEGEPDAEQPEA